MRKAVCAACGSKARRRRKFCKICEHVIHDRTLPSKEAIEWAKREIAKIAKKGS